MDGDRISTVIGRRPAAVYRVIDEEELLGGPAAAPSFASPATPIGAHAPAVGRAARARRALLAAVVLPIAALCVLLATAGPAAPPHPPVIARRAPARVVRPTVRTHAPRPHRVPHGPPRGRERPVRSRHALSPVRRTAAPPALPPAPATPRAPGAVLTAPAADEFGFER
jgi:hypothetical protein